MRKNSIVFRIVLVFLLLITFNTKCFAEEDGFAKMTLYEKQNYVVEVANNYSKNNKKMDSTDFIYKVYSEASDGMILLAQDDNLNFYNRKNWLVVGALPKTEDDILYIYNNAQNYKQQKEKELININLLLSGLKKGDILIFTSKNSSSEEVMLYIGDGIVLYCDSRNGIQEFNLPYYLGLAPTVAIKKDELAYDEETNPIRDESDLPLVAIARPLTYGGYVLPYIPEQKFYSNVFYKTYSNVLHKSSSSYFTPMLEQNIEYEDNTQDLTENLVDKVYAELTSSDNSVYKIFSIIKNITSMLLLGVVFILGIKYMTESNIDKKSKMKMNLIVFFLGAVIIFAADKIALLFIKLLI